MNEKLNKNKIDYLLFHLERHFTIDDSISRVFRFGEFPTPEDKVCIFFPLSEGQLRTDFRIENIPVLYPLSSLKQFYSFDKNKNLIFTHDLLKSAFYLLSGYQELKPERLDNLGRFPFDCSIQKKLNITSFPLVNAYFEIIKSALKEFCTLHGLSFSEKKVWGDQDFAFLLTHDVDRVDKWTFGEFKRRLKMLIRNGFTKYWGYSVESFLNLFSNKNPYWNFNWLKSLEMPHAFRSVWFFLPQGHPQIDAYYSFKEKRIQKLAKFILENKDEIGLHGTFLSKDNPKIMQQNLNKVQSLSGNPVKISRQHWLSFKYPDTLRILEKIGVKYDSSWAFAEHIGWRNSYCLPFKTYDIEQDRMMDIWELPLTIMDVTLFQYMGLSLEHAEIKIKEIITTCKKYNGLLVLLWHNSHFDEYLLPGISNFYKNILRLIASESPKQFSTQEWIHL